jgi:hypothetical protein
MPNIVMVGFLDFHSKQFLPLQIATIVREIKQEAQTVITALEVPVMSIKDSKQSPYIIVRCDNRDNAIMVGRILNEKLNVDVECEVLERFLTSRPLPNT